MFKIKELTSILIIIIVFTFVVLFRQLLTQGIDLAFFLTVLIITSIILFSNTLSKKITAFLLDSEIEHKILQWQRYWIYEKSYFKNPLPAGMLFPFLFSLLSQGYFLVLTFLEFEVSPLLSRVRKSAGGFYRYSELTEYHIGLIAGVGIIVNLVLAAISYFIPYPPFQLFGKLSIYFAFWNLLPLGKLDGTKIFFGSRIFWSILAIITVIALGYALFLL